MQRYLVLEDGTIYPGDAFGAQCSAVGELVFNTGMSGYQESITDQSYNGEILMFTYPLIGNYGINRDDDESIQPTCAGVVVHELARCPSNWRQDRTLDQYLTDHNIPGIQGIDTRSVTRHIRQKGALKAALVDQITTDTVAQLQQQTPDRHPVWSSSTKNPYPGPDTGHKVVVIDFGLKYSILRELSQRHCNFTVLPATATAQQVLALNPDGILLSNGPGDPKDVPAALAMIQTVQTKIPLFGICLGHQLFALANGADTFKLKFGHRGFNHPVRDLLSGRIYFTAQNHGYAVDRESLKQTNLTVTQEEIHDHTVEGLQHQQFPAFSVQYHPDAAPGPHDTQFLFDHFMQLMAKQAERKTN